MERASSKDGFKCHFEKCHIESIEIKQVVSEKCHDHFPVNGASKVVEASSTPNDQKTSEIVEILEYSNRAKMYLEKQLYNEAYGITSKLYKYGPGVSYCTDLISLYCATFSTQRHHKCPEILDQLIKILKEKLAFPTKEFLSAADVYYDKHQETFYIKALLFYQIAVKLQTTTSDARENFVLWKCCEGMKNSMEKLLCKCRSYQAPCQACIIPAMQEITERIPNQLGRTKKFLLIKQAECLHMMHICHNFLGDTKASKKILEKIIKSFYDSFGKEAAETFQPVAAAYKNLGEIHLQISEPAEALETFTKSIQLQEKAQYFDSKLKQNESILATRDLLHEAEELKRDLSFTSTT